MPTLSYGFLLIHKSKAPKVSSAVILYLFYSVKQHIPFPNSFVLIDGLMSRNLGCGLSKCSIQTLSFGPQDKLPLRRGDLSNN